MVRYKTRISSRWLCLARHYGASATEYAVLLALLSILSMGVLYALGGSVGSSFESADGRLASAQEEGVRGTHGPTASDPIASDPQMGCYEDTSGDFTHTFPASDPHTCFHLFEGTDTVAFESAADLTVTGTDGSKTLTLGEGNDALDLAHASDVPAPDLSENLDTAVPINTGAGHDRVRFTAPRGVGLDTGPGNDSIELLAIPPSSTLRGRIIRPGVGANTVVSQCTGGHTRPVRIAVQGQDTITSQGCYTMINPIPAPSGQALPGVEVALQGAQQTYIQPSVYPAADSRLRYVEVAGSGDYTLYNVYAYPDSGGQANGLEYVRADTSGPSVSGTIRGMTGESADINLRHTYTDSPTGLGQFNLYNPRAAWSLSTTTSLTPTPMTRVSYYYDATRADTGLPAVTTQNGDIMFYLNADGPGNTCWQAVLTNASGGTQTLSCATRRHFFDNIATTTWRRLTFTNPVSGAVYTFNFNGASAPVQATRLTVCLTVNGYSCF